MEKRNENTFTCVAIHAFLLSLFVNSSAFYINNGAEELCFDFIVVGAGSAGSVVAARLSERYRVLLIDRSGDPHPDLDIPAKTIDFYGNEEYVKFYETVPQKNAGLMTNGTVLYLAGNTLGGGSGVNGMMYNRGSPHNYDRWANMTQDAGWSYANLLKYFKKIEDYHGNFPSEEAHGRGGPIPVMEQKYSPGLATWLKAGENFGYPITGPNQPQIPSFAPVEFNRDRGRRVSSYKGYIKKVLATRPQLKLIKHAKVTRILFQGNKAVGVKYVLNGSQPLTACASKEVILSAGALSSPAILMKSGIGPKDVLDAANIPPVKYLPVGYSLQDHPLLLLQLFVKKDKVEVFLPERDLTPETLKLYEQTGDGPYSCFNGLTAQAFLVSTVRQREPAPSPNWADLHFILMQMPFSLGIDGMADDSTKDEISISTLILFTGPKSRGRLLLNMTNIESDPLVDFNYFSHPDDMEAMVDGAKKVIKLFEETAAYQGQGARYSTVPIPFCKQLPYRSDEYWKCYVSYMSGAGYHGAGTCRMGKDPFDKDAVVDSKLRVIGVVNLRVVDNSIMPILTNANTQVPAFVIGEKAADDILKDWSGWRPYYKS